MSPEVADEKPALLTWMRENLDSIPTDLIYREAAIDQMRFFRDRIDALFIDQERPLEWRNQFCKIDGWHTSKSVRLPVYNFHTDRIAVWARGNFHNWNVTISGPRDFVLPDYFNIDSANGYLFFEGMEVRKCGCYADDKRQFSFCVWDDLQLFAVMWCIASQVRASRT